ncbi:MAG: type II toxin-antitoxin system HicA family toxin [Acidimicrobiales bacterium]
MKVRDILRILKDEGWVQVRQTGSHRQFHHPTRRGVVTVKRHTSRDLSPGVVSSIMKQA